MTTQPAPPPDDHGTVLRDAISHHQAGRLDDAESRYRQVLEGYPENPDALHLLGVLSSQKGSDEAGIALIRRAIASDGRNPAFHSNLGNVLQKLGRFDEAAEAYEAAIGLQPENVDALADLGAVYQLQGRFDAAEAACRRAIGVRPDFVRGHYNLGISLKSLGRAEEALDALSRTVQLDPTQIDAQLNVAGILLEQGKAGEALEACDACLAVSPQYSAALGYKGIALNEVGDREGVRRLMDFGRLMRPSPIEVPESFSGLESFNRALADHILNHPTLEEDPELQATRNGLHTRELLSEPLGPFAEFHQALQRKAQAYLHDLPSDPSHPFTASKPSSLKLTIWAVVMNAGGHQLPHNHGDGYFSGVYYVQVPDVVARSGDGQEGWIEFGRPPDEFNCRVEPEVITIQPEEGLVLLFPSYVYHRTIPFTSDQQRISIAFDFLTTG